MGSKYGFDYSKIDNSKGLAVAAFILLTLTACNFSIGSLPKFSAGPAQSPPLFGCEGSKKITFTRDSLENFLRSTTSVSKQLISTREFDEASLQSWTFDPPLYVAFQQAWMKVSTTTLVIAMKVQRQDSILSIWLKTNDAGILFLQGGKEPLHLCQ
jgi:hypothetical protein